MGVPVLPCYPRDGSHAETHDRRHRCIPTSNARGQRTVADRPCCVQRKRIVYRPTKCEVAILITDGLKLQSIAVRIGLGIGTVRHHLKHVFEKTGARSQAALVALLRGFADPTH